MRETGTVAALRSNEVVLRMDAGALQERCARCGCCAAHADGTRLLTLPVDTDARLASVAVGDRVELETRLPNPALAALILFGIPLLAIAAGAWLGGRLAPEAEAALSAGGAAGAVVGALCVWRINRMLVRSAISMLAVHPADGARIL